MAEATVWELASDIKFMLRIESAHHQTRQHSSPCCSTRAWRLQHRKRSCPDRGGPPRDHTEETSVLLAEKGLAWLQILYLLNQQTARLRGLPVEAVPGLLPPLGAGKGASTTETESLVANFLHPNGFCHLHDRDSARWSPICYAAVGGNPTLIQALLEQRASANDSIKKMKRDAQLPRGMHVLQMCAMIGHNAAMKVLIAARADVHAGKRQRPASPQHPSQTMWWAFVFCAMLAPGSWTRMVLVWMLCGLQPLRVESMRRERFWPEVLRQTAGGPCTCP